MKFIDKIKNNELGKNILVLMTGNGFAQVFVILISPILSRLFSPAEIGIYAFLLGIVNIFTVISSGRYEQAIVVSKNDQEAINVLALGTALVSIMSVISFLIILILLNSGFLFFEGHLAESWAFSIPVINFLLSLYLLLRYFSIRKKSFKHLSFSIPTESIIKGALSIALGWYIGGAWGLIVGGIAGSFFSILIIYNGISSPIRENIKYIKFSEIKRLAKEHYKFPAYDAPNALIYAFSQQGILVFIPKLFSEQIAGIYSYTNRILLTPIRFFAGSYTQVMYQKLSEVRDNNEYYFALIAKSTNRIFYILLIPFAIFVFTSKYYIPFVFGDEWVDLYKLMYLLSPYSLMVLISPAFTNVFIIDNKQDISLKLKIVFVILRLGILFIGAIYNWEILFVFALFSIASTASMLLNYFVYYRISKQNLPQSIYSFILVSAITYACLFLYLI